MNPGVVCRETAVHGPRRIPREPLRGCSGPLAPRAGGEGAHKGPSVRHKGHPVLLAPDHPRMAGKSPIQRWLRRPPSARGGPWGPQPGPAGRRRVRGSPRGLMLQGSWAALGRRVVVLRGEQMRCHQATRPPGE